MNQFITFLSETINGDGTEQNEWNGMNKRKYTRLDYNVTEYTEWKRISSVSWSIISVCVCVFVNYVNHVYVWVVGQMENVFLDVEKSESYRLI